MTHQLPPHIYVDTASKWEQCLTNLHNTTQFALDLESNGLFAYQESICLLQISTRTQDYIVDPLVALDWRPFGELIESPAIEKVLHASEYDLILMRRQHGWQLNNLFDTMWAARILGYEKVGLANMLSALYGFQISKKFQRANWCGRPLQPAQLAYAQTDTHFLLKMRDDLETEIFKRGYGGESAEIFYEQTHLKLPDTTFDPESFWSINGVRGLKPRNRAILRQLNIWRDRVAKERNLPHFKILSNNTLIRLASVMPTRHQELVESNIIKKMQLRRYGRAILNVVSQGKQAPIPRQSRRKRPPEAVVSRHEQLMQWRKQRARARGVASDVVMTRDMLWYIATHHPQSIDELAQTPFLGEWRLDEYGAEILALLGESTEYDSGY